MRLSAIHVLAASLAGSCVQAFGPCIEATPKGNATYRFSYVQACNTWAWIADDLGLELSIQADCSLRQNWPNFLAASYVCIQRSPGPSANGTVPDKCFWTPERDTTYQACQLPVSHCPGIAKVEGWPRMSPSGASQ
ncbi:hypothetical protein CSHISOI_11741 [Colletotrichum shisoi]|uniref:Uncharacterized protein n=1 Tax=Colletotrichum shisoi TaxID=2078593 RepID=A0A5Q4B9R6_9PEZI|nr:hypothetical protein CSHISOI_11741 [Colletotrichum shisoi]